MAITFTLKEVVIVGGAFFSVGGLTTWSIVHGKNITALWLQKQDVNVCETEHTPIKKDIAEIKKDVKTLLRQNGGHHEGS